MAVSSKVQEYNPRSGLLQAAVVAMFATYLVWSSVTSEPAGTWGCDRLFDNDKTAQRSGVWIAIVGL